jgi:DNA-binding LytR/AlgR family response regulator
MQVLIVEDEPLMAKQLKKLLAEIEPTAQIAGITQSVEESVAWLRQHPAPDLILMDIELADGQSFDIFKQTDVQSPVIFTTAYDEYAIRAFKVNSIDYLLKPIKGNELKAGLQKFEKQQREGTPKFSLAEIAAALQSAQQPAERRHRFLVKQAQRLVSIDAGEVAYIFSENGYSFLRTVGNQKFIIEHKLDELEASLSPTHFFRANRQFILHHQAVVVVHPWFNQKLKIDMRPPTDEPVVVSRDKAALFKAWLGE